MDPDEGFNDSGVDTVYTSDMESVTSSNYTFRHNGRRRYHGIVANPYPFPNDDEEVTRLDELQYVIRCFYGRNVLAPISRKATRILDIGTGSGRWAVEVAEKFPKAWVIGMDLSPVQPTEVPDNCEFRVGDLTESLDDYNDGSFDLIHSRIVGAGVRADQWDRYISDVYRLLKPGDGWAQFGEIQSIPIWDDDSVPPDSLLARFFKMVHIVLEERRGLIISGGGHLIERFKKAGFVDIKVIKRNIDIGDWRGDAKTASGARVAIPALSKSIPPFMIHFKEWFPDDEEREEAGKKIVEDFGNPAYHMYAPMTVVIGRKPNLDAHAEV